MMDPREGGHQPLLHQRSLLLESQEKKRKFFYFYIDQNYSIALLLFQLTLQSFILHGSHFLYHIENQVKHFRCSDEFTSIFSSVEHHQSRLAQGTHLHQSNHACIFHFPLFNQTRPGRINQQIIDCGVDVTKNIIIVMM